MRAERSSPPGLFATRGFARLWAVGGIANAMLWLEVLAASVFTLDVTGSAWQTALVSAARSAPLIGAGALVGVVADAGNRKHIILGGLMISVLASGSIGLLAAVGWAKPWHVGVAALVSGFVYATEMPARRRMIAESAGAAHVERAVAADSLTSYAARCIGPLLGGLAYQTLGLSGAFLTSAACNLVAACLVAGMDYRQETRALAFGPVRRDLRDGLAFVRYSPALLVLLAVTVTMNLLGYSYAALVAPVARLSFGLNAVMTGVLASAEPFGAFLGGLALMRLTLPGPQLSWLMGGVAILTGGIVAAACTGMLGGPLILLCVILAGAGVGSAIYTLNQTTIVLAETPPALRSRIMGLVTVCIGCWPLGIVLAGVLAGALPPLRALAVLAALGLGAIGGLAAVVQMMKRPIAGRVS